MKFRTASGSEVAAHVPWSRVLRERSAALRPFPVHFEERSCARTTALRSNTIRVRRPLSPKSDYARSHHEADLLGHLAMLPKSRTRTDET